MHAHDRHEQAQLRQLHRAGDAALSDLLRKYCQVLAGLLVVGVVLLLYVQPNFLFQRSAATERLPGRSILTLFPANVNVQGSLPRFFMSYGEFGTCKSRVVNDLGRK